VNAENRPDSTHLGQPMDLNHGLYLLHGSLDLGICRRVAWHGYDQVNTSSLHRREDGSQCLCCCCCLGLATVQAVLVGEQALPDWVAERHPS